MENQPQPQQQEPIRRRGRPKTKTEDQLEASRLAYMRAYYRANAARMKDNAKRAYQRKTGKV